jgi:hypothetical protein
VEKEMLIMGVRAVWDEQQSCIMHYYFDARWTWDDVYLAFNEAHAQIEEKAKPIGVILSGPDNMLIPPNMLTHMRKLMGNKKRQVHQTGYFCNDQYVYPHNGEYFDQNYYHRTPYRV